MASMTNGPKSAILAGAICLGSVASVGEELTYESLTVLHEANLNNARTRQDAWGDRAIQNVAVDLNPLTQQSRLLADTLRPAMPIPIPRVGKHIQASLFSGPAFQRYWSYELPDTVDPSFDPVAHIPLDVLLGWEPRDTLITMNDMPGVGDVSVRSSYTYPNDDYFTFIKEVYRSKHLRQTLPTDSYELTTGITSSRGGEYRWTRTATPSQFTRALEEGENEALGMSKAD